MSRTPTSREDVLALIEAHPMGDTPRTMREAFPHRTGPQPKGEAHPFGLAFGSGPKVLFFHGGGYVFGSPESHGHAAARLAAAGLRVVLPRYPLAPERPWPAQLDAARAALDAVEGSVAVAGISAGGHLALNLALAARGRVAALALMSPNTDRTGLSRTREANANADAMNDDASDRALGEMALGGLRDDDPEKSPLLADLRVLPPTFLSVGLDEVLLDDTLLLSRRLGLAGVETRLETVPGAFHMAHLWPQALPPAGAALDRMGAWLRGMLAGRRPAGDVLLS
ncbi:acetyl esterase/lipase [Hasllibacter halocynthiae]|uniref:Acetyl esterase/lipase n=1 Tax=Hasllibacter halocynthiae TaxID=595589 RepID=A0A2T0X6F6_9RHOB|nr:alpha/beta hydrolase fold domain-containing protein [Hasllibacter halocynthiae]PRY94528.1 acetyl esterase/lipase [Hasllibacter halocynthiae]